jgi:hypothetical protein
MFNHPPPPPPCFASRPRLTFENRVQWGADRCTLSPVIITACPKAARTLECRAFHVLKGTLLSASCSSALLMSNGLDLRAGSAHGTAVQVDTTLAAQGSMTAGSMVVFTSMWCAGVWVKDGGGRCVGKRRQKSDTIQQGKDFVMSDLGKQEGSGVLHAWACQ